MRSRRFTTAVSLVVAMLGVMGVSASSALAGEAHPPLFEFGTGSGSFENPNGIAIDQSSGDVYVAAIGTDAVYKFTAAGVPITTWGANGQLTGIPAQSGKPAELFAFPAEPRGTPAAIAVDNSKSPSDPSAGDLYVMDAGHGVIDKFSSEGKYLSQITGFALATGSAEGELLGLAVDADGVVHADLHVNNPGSGLGQNGVAIDEFDASSANNLVAEQKNNEAHEPQSGLPFEPQDADGFAVGPTGDDFLLYGGSCSCTAKLGQQLAGLGELDNAGSGDVAVAVDPATGHVYVDDQSSVVEWDTGALNGGNDGFGGTGTGTLVSSFSRAGLSGSSGQGGIAVNGWSWRHLCR